MSRQRRRRAAGPAGAIVGTASGAWDLRGRTEDRAGGGRNACRTGLPGSSGRRRATAAWELNGGEGGSLLADLDARHARPRRRSDLHARHCARRDGARVAGVAVERRLQGADEIVMEDGARRQADPIQDQPRHDPPRPASRQRLTHEVSIALAPACRSCLPSPDRRRADVLSVIGRLEPPSGASDPRAD